MKIALGLYLIFVTTTGVAQGSFITLGELPEEVFETSGLLFFNDHIVTHNDSGGAPVLFEIDTVSRQIARTVTITNATNVDWEALSQDEQYIYIGDFGNNVGTRKDLTIYRIAKEDYLDDDTATAESILFSYEDQTDFADTGNSDWDAEAFFVLDNELVILTKQWKSLGSVAYSIPKIPGTHTALRGGAAQNIGLVTDADYNATNGTLFIVGYSAFLMPFARTYSLAESEVFSGTFNPIPIDIGFAQIEGVASDGIGNYFVTSELFTRQSPNIVSLSRLFKLNLIDLQEEPMPEEPEGEEEPNPNPLPEDNDESLLIYNELSSGTIRYSINSDSRINGTRIYDVNGKTVWEQFNTEIEKEGVIAQNIPTSIYYFVVYFDTTIRSKAFAVY